MLETPAFQETDLLRRGQSFFPALIQPLQQFRCFPGVIDLIRQDPQFFQCLFLFFRWRCHFPAECRDIPGKVFCLDTHLKLQRIYQLSLSTFHLCQFLRQRFLSLRHDIFRRRLLCLFDVYRTAGIFLQIFCHLLGDLFILADQVRRMAQFMTLCMP